jgi:Zn-dependent oligopeptidase
MRVFILLAVIWTTGTLTACEPPAGDEALGRMCENLVKLRGEVKVKTDAEVQAEVEERFAQTKKRLEDWLARDLASWDKELEAKLRTIEDKEEKQRISEEYAKKKEITRQQHLPGIAELEPKKTAALEEAEKKQAAARQNFGQRVEACVADARAAGTSQKLAQCRIEATSKDAYWNKCR